MAPVRKGQTQPVDDGLFYLFRGNNMITYRT